MSRKEDDITKIEDLPEIDRSQEEETEFTDLEQMAKDLGLQEQLPRDESSSPPDLPQTDTNFSEESFESDTFQGEDIFEENESDFGNDFSSEYESEEDDEPENENSSYFSDENDFEENDENNFNFNDEASEENYTNEATDSFSLSAFDEPNSLMTEDSEDLLEEENLSESLDLNSPPSNDFVEHDINTSQSPTEIIDNLEASLIETSIETKDELDTSDPSDEIAQNEIASRNEVYENFQEVTEFANEAHNLDYISEGNPPFSIILKDIIYEEDAKSIIEILHEYGLCPNDQKDQIKTTINNGQYLIPRLSEYMAIKLCHKFRSLEVDILMGLTEEISPPKSYNSNDRGLINKGTIKNNKRYTLKNIKDLESTNVLATTLNQLDGHIIREYLGVCTLKRTLHLNSQNDRFKEEEIFQSLENESKSRLEMLRLKRENQK